MPGHGRRGGCSGRAMGRRGRACADPASHRQGTGGVRPWRGRRQRGQLARAVGLARVCGDASHLVLALTALAQAELGAGDATASAATLAEAHDTAESEAILPAALRELHAAEARIGRHRPPLARRGGPRPLVEDLTEREVSILRALQGQLSQREIGAEMFISLNTVKGYTKSLYRNLDVTSRQAAVQRGRALGLI
jgi:LuxR family transcriptional regulator, maltose regulon positive regulatory protein